MPGKRNADESLGACGLVPRYDCGVFTRCLQRGALLSSDLTGCWHQLERMLRSPWMAGLLVSGMLNPFQLRVSSGRGWFPLPSILSLAFLDLQPLFKSSHCTWQSEPRESITCHVLNTWSFRQPQAWDLVGKLPAPRTAEN